MKKILTYAWKLLLLLLFLAAAFSYAMFQGGFVSWFLFYAFLPFALYALLIVFYPLKSFFAERNFSRSVLTAGEDVTVKLTLTRKFPFFPLPYLVVEDHFCDETICGMEKGSQKTIVFPWFRKVIEFDYQLKNLPRGEYCFHFVTLKTGDFFGSIEKEKLILLPGKILVYPACEKISPRLYTMFYEEDGIPVPDKFQRNMTLVSGVREYQPGDRFSWIDWKAAAKRGRMMTKEFEQEKSGDVLIVLDCTPASSFETMVSFAASVIKGLLENGMEAGLMTTSAERARIPVGGGEEQGRNLFYHLAKVKADGTAPLDKVLAEEDVFIRQHTAVMIVTSAAGLSERLVDRASSLASKKRKVTVYAVLDEHVEPAGSPVFPAKGVPIISVRKGRFAGAFSEVIGGCS